MELLEKLLDNKASKDNTICLNAYAQGIIDSKALEMIEILKEANKVIEWYMENTRPDNDNYTDFFNLGMNTRTEIEKLINEATNV